MKLKETGNEADNEKPVGQVGDSLGAGSSDDEEEEEKVDEIETYKKMIELMKPGECY